MKLFLEDHHHSISLYLYVTIVAQWFYNEKKVLPRRVNFLKMASSSMFVEHICFFVERNAKIESSQSFCTTSICS